MIILCRTIIVLVVYIFISGVSHAEILEVPPPRLVECNSPNSCDRNHENLEQFVKGFYEWYINNEDMWFRISKDEQAIAKYSSNKERVIRGLISSDFFHHYKTVKPLEDDYNPKYCYPDTDTFLCAQDWDKEWFVKAKYRTVEISTTNAVIYITINAEYQIIINLKVINDAWCIDSVKSPD
jgi:hypothetical protein